MIAFEDSTHEGNSPKHHTGKPCYSWGCEKPAGTWWSPLWCFNCNVERIQHINKKLDPIRKLVN